jgi:mono/diheme cytochrome c family protein
MKKLRIIVSLTIGIGLFSSCYYDKSELVYPPNATPCDTLAVSYRSDVLSIISSNCYSCHSGDASGGAGLKLDSYANLKMMSGALVQVLQHDPGYAQMPKNGGKLSDCNIAKIRTWVRNGSPDN